MNSDFGAMSTEDTWSHPPLTSSQASTIRSSSIVSTSNLTSKFNEVDFTSLKLKEMMVLVSRLQTEIARGEEERLEWLNRHFASCLDIDETLRNLSAWLESRIAGLESFSNMVEQRILPLFTEDELKLEDDLSFNVCDLVNRNWPTKSDLQIAIIPKVPAELISPVSGKEDLLAIKEQATKLLGQAQSMQAGIEALQTIVMELVKVERSRRLQERLMTREARIASLKQGLSTFRSLLEDQRDYEQATHLLLALLQLASTVSTPPPELAQTCQLARDLLLADFRRTVGPRGHTPEDHRHRLALGCLLADVLDGADLGKNVTSMRTLLVGLVCERLLSDYSSVFGSGEGLASLSRRLRYFHRLLLLYRTHIWPIMPRDWQVRTMLTIHWAALTGKVLVEDAPLATVDADEVIAAWQLSREWEREMESVLADEQTTNCCFLSPLLEPVLIERVIRPWEQEWLAKCELQRPKDWSVVENSLRSTRGWPRPVIPAALQLEASINERTRRLNISPGKLQQELNAVVNRCCSSFVRRLEDCLPLEKSIKKRLSSFEKGSKGVLLWMIACLNTVSFLQEKQADSQQLLVARSIVLNSLMHALEVALEASMRQMRKRQPKWNVSFRDAVDHFTNLICEHGYPTHLSLWQEKVSESIPGLIERNLWQMKPMSVSQAEQLLMEMQPVKELLLNHDALNARVLTPLKVLAMGEQFAEGLQLLMPDATEETLKNILEMRNSQSLLSEFKNKLRLI